MAALVTAYSVSARIQFATGYNASGTPILKSVSISDIKSAYNPATDDDKLLNIVDALEPIFEFTPYRVQRTNVYTVERDD